MQDNDGSQHVPWQNVNKVQDKPIRSGKLVFVLSFGGCQNRVTVNNMFTVVKGTLLTFLVHCEPVFWQGPNHNLFWWFEINVPKKRRLHRTCFFERGSCSQFCHSLSLTIRQGTEKHLYLLRFQSEYWENLRKHRIILVPTCHGDAGFENEYVFSIEEERVRNVAKFVQHIELSSSQCYFCVSTLLNKTGKINMRALQPWLLT